MHLRTQDELNYRVLTHQERIDVIYEYVIHKTAIRTVAKKFDQRYTTVRTIIKSYEKDNRTNRKMNYWTKATYLKNEKSKQCQVG